MREIKFRAWDKKNKRLYDPMELRDGALVGFRSICWDNPIILMQFTGLLDKQGKEIYEGDILLFDYGHYTLKKIVVEFFHGCFGICGYDTLNGERMGETWFRTLMDVLQKGKIEIIGNIWENKELLKED